MTATPENADSHPDVALPAGATGTDWQPGRNWFDDGEARDVRLIRGQERHVGRAATVYAQAFQFPDGTIVDGDDGPSVVVEGLNGEGQGLASGQARAVAMAVSAAADEADQWVRQ